MDRGDCADQQNADQRDDKISFRDYRQETHARDAEQHRHRHDHKRGPANRAVIGV